MLITLICLIIILLTSLSLRNKNKIPFVELIKLTSWIWITSFLILGFFLVIKYYHTTGLLGGIVFTTFNISYEFFYSIPAFIIYSLICSILITNEYHRILKNIIPLVTLIISIINFWILGTIELDESIFSVWAKKEFIFSFLLIILTFTLSSLFWINKKVKSKNKKNSVEVRDTEIAN